MAALRIREFIGLVALIVLALGGGLLMQGLQGEPHARWMAIATLVSFLGVTIGVVKWMEG